MHTLVIGGIRSGKTALAERLARNTDGEVVYLATATAGDDEMRRRIDRHQRQRPVNWGLSEEPLALASVLALHASAGQKAPCILVDCMSLWVSNLLHAGETVFCVGAGRVFSTAGPVPG